MSISKVKSVQPNGTFDSAHGTLYKFEYEMEDGAVLNANHKKEGGNFPVGAEVEYEIKGTNDYGSWGAVRKPEDKSGAAPHKGGGSGKFDTTGVEVGHAINNAVHLAIAEKNIGIDNIEKKAQEIFGLAQKMKKQVSDHRAKPPGSPGNPIPAAEKKAASEQPHVPKAVQDSIDNDLANQDDDLPF